jgi:uncharacterized protein (TIGR03067 family)
MAIVSCPECQKRLKVADASIGKKVKCSCGRVFVAEAEAAAPAAVASDKVMVACSECGAKLKVAGTSLGKKMKCPKCASVFVAAVEKAPRVEPLSKANAKPAKADDEDEDEDLLTFAQSDEKDEDAPVRRTGKHADAVFAGEEVEAAAKGKPGRKPVPDDTEDEEFPWQKDEAKKADPDDDEPTPKGKAGKKGAKPLLPKEAADQKPVYPSRFLLNIVVAIMMLGFIAIFAAFFFGKEIGPLVGLDNGFHADLIGLPNPHIVKLPKVKIEPEDPAAEAAREAANKKDTELLQGTWVVESAEEDGAALDEAKGEKYVFADGRVTGKLVGSVGFTIDANTKPEKSIRPGAPEKGKPGPPGIYKFDGGKLYWCMSIVTAQVPDEKKRKSAWKVSPEPKDFVSTHATLLVLKREAKEKTDGKNKQAAAKAQIATLDQATKAYKLKNNEFPAALKDLVPDYVKNEEALIDPWKQPYQYDASGPKNNGTQPDIWTVTPTKEVIGNWPKAKSKAPPNGP